MRISCLYLCQCCSLYFVDFDRSTAGPLNGRIVFSWNACKLWNCFDAGSKQMLNSFLGRSHNRWLRLLKWVVMSFDESVLKRFAISVCCVLVYFWRLSASTFCVLAGLFLCFWCCCCLSRSIVLCALFAIVQPVWMTCFPSAAMRNAQITASTGGITTLVDAILDPDCQVCRFAFSQFVMIILWFLLLTLLIACCWR